MYMYINTDQYCFIIIVLVHAIMKINNNGIQVKDNNYYYNAALLSVKK